MDYHYKQDYLIGYGEVDEYNRMRISALLNYLQNVATMHSKQLGYGTTECNDLNIGWILLSWHIQFFSYPKGDTAIEIKTWSRGMKGCHAFRGYEVSDENGQLVARVDSMWTLIDKGTGRPIRLTEEIKNVYGTIDKFYFENEKVKIDASDKIDSKINLTVQRRDIDTNKHCNNTKYIEYALESIPEELYSQKVISELEIIYKKAVLYKQNIEVTCTCADNDEYINTIKNENGEIVTLIKTKWSQFD